MTDWIDTPLHLLIEKSSPHTGTALSLTRTHFRKAGLDTEPTARTLTKFREVGLGNVHGLGVSRTKLIKTWLEDHGARLRGDNESLPYETPFLEAAALVFIAAERSRPVAIGLARGRKPVDVKLGEVLTLDPAKVLNVGLKPLHFTMMGRVAGELRRVGYKAPTVAPQPAQASPSIETFAAAASRLVKDIDKIVANEAMGEDLASALFELRKAANDAIKSVDAELSSQTRVNTFGWD